ncbi:uncharacterized protein [Spinacia oleracea]|uniref:TTF-type domain-containing protein n=1 Tax=Spinacia oleracea TaxID=3562 RepID=A0ABM3RUX5_SPIOL|nr:uncharacterized protein LOC130472445 [Spinacia oleracea]
MKRKTIDSYFTKAKPPSEFDIGNSDPSETTEPNINVNPQTSTQIPDEEPTNSSTMQSMINVGNKTLMRDPALRKPIDSYPSKEQEDIVNAYIHYGSYRFPLSKYPPSGPINHPRRFQHTWFKKFNWLEYSPTSDAAYCFPCFLYLKDPLGKSGSDAFTVQGFKNWKKVGGKECSFSTHMEKDTNSAHGYSSLCWENAKKTGTHIDKALEKPNPQLIENNLLRIKTSIEIVRWLTFQNCAFRGHDESSKSKNQGNFLEMLKLLAYYNKDVHDVVMGNAPQNAKYTSPAIQKEILQVFADKVQKTIREEIGDSKFCIIVDESRDISKREQMAIVIRFVDRNGFLLERFFELVHVKDTTSKTLKEEISIVLSNHELSIQNLRGQGYDGASNMRGEWNGLQALFMRDCPYAYYVHCLAHQLQLALIAAAREVGEVHDFFKDLIFIVNTVSSSTKRHDEL